MGCRLGAGWVQAGCGRGAYADRGCGGEERPRREARRHLLDGKAAQPEEDDEEQAHLAGLGLGSGLGLASSTCMPRPDSSSDVVASPLASSEMLSRWRWMLGPVRVRGKG